MDLRGDPVLENISESTARKLQTLTNEVTVDTSAAPINGKILTAISSTEAIWKIPAPGRTLQSFNNVITLDASPDPVIDDVLVATTPTTAIWKIPPPTKRLKTLTTEVAIDGATAPTTGQVLAATSSSTATWQTITTAPTANTIALRTTGADVNVGNSAPPAVNDVLRATSATTAIWTTSRATTLAGAGGSTIGLGGVTNPVKGQVLTAISDSMATWQYPISRIFNFDPMQHISHMGTDSTKTICQLFPAIESDINIMEINMGGNYFNAAGTVYLHAAVYRGTPSYASANLVAKGTNLASGYPGVSNKIFRFLMTPEAGESLYFEKGSDLTVAFWTNSNGAQLYAVPAVADPEFCWLADYAAGASNTWPSDLGGLLPSVSNPLFRVSISLGQLSPYAS